MQQKTEDLVEKADAFVEENQELVGEAGPDTLGRIVQHGAPIAVQLSELHTERSRLTADALSALETAIKGQQATPREMYKLEELLKHRHREYERVNDAMSRFISFLEGVTDLLNAPEEDTERVKPEEQERDAEKMGLAEWPEFTQDPKYLWRKLFS